MRPHKRITRSDAAWRKLCSRQSIGGPSVHKFSRREEIKPNVFRRWRLTLSYSDRIRRVTARSELAAQVSGPPADLSDLRCCGSQLKALTEIIKIVKDNIEEKHSRSYSTGAPP